MEKKWIAATVLSAFLLTGAPTAAMAQNVTVTLPTFPVTLNGYEMQPTYDEYPVLVYQNITYFPMTGYYGGFLGLDTRWADNTLTVKKELATSKNLRWYEKKEANKNKYTASVATYNIVVNGKKIQNSKEQYPLLRFRDVTYFPLTWRFAVEEFGWEYTFDAKSGLKINSKSEIEINGKLQLYAIKDNIAIGYPFNTYGDQYIFTYKQGNEPEKEFTLESQLQDGDYYFYAQKDENDCLHQAEIDMKLKPSIEGNILTLPCVRQTTEKENLILKIDFVKGEIISKTAV